MNTQEQIKALAELDGFVLRGKWWTPTSETPQTMPRDMETGCPLYLSSYDAIIPLMQKQPESIRIGCYKRLKELLFDGCPIGSAAIIDIAFQTPSQLAEALLRATGKWIE